MSLRCSLSGNFGRGRALLTAPAPLAPARRPLARMALLGALALLLFPPARAGQQDLPFGAPDDYDRGHDPFRRRDNRMPPATYQRIEQINARRQREMTGQAARLLQLATELNSATEHPSPSNVQKAEAVARLAHSLRQAMEFAITP